MIGALIYTGTALAGGLVVSAFAEALRRRRRREVSRERVRRALTRGAVALCSPADAAQPFIAACVGGCSWHRHEPTNEIAETAARKHADAQGHPVAWGSAREFKA